MVDRSLVGASADCKDMDDSIVGYCILLTTTLLRIAGENKSTEPLTSTLLRLSNYN